MSRRVQLLTYLAIFSIAGVRLYVFSRLAFPISPSYPQFAAIENTLRVYAEIKAQAVATLDDSRLAEVLIKHWRGGPADPEDVKYVEAMTGKPTMIPVAVGLLDIERAKLAIMRRDTARASASSQPHQPLKFTLISVASVGGFAVAKVDWE